MDAWMFFAENETTPLQIASVSVFEGPPPTYGEFMREVVARLVKLPRFRQRVRRVPLDLGRPVWVDDPHLQILYHVRHTAVPAPGGTEELRNLAGRVLAQRLDLSRPLWEMWLVEGLEEGRWAIISKVHHCMVDGVGGSDLLTGLFDLGPEARSPDRRPTAIPLPAPEPEPSRSALLLRAVAGTATEQVRLAARLPCVLRRGARAGFLRDLAAYARRLRAGAGASSLNGPTSPYRRWSWAQADLDAARRVGEVFGGTVNDVVLAAVARGFRDLLAERHELGPDTVVRAMVPVSIRLPGEGGALTNRVSAVLVSLPCGEADPVRRLELVRGQSAALKESRQRAGPALAIRMLGLVPTVLAMTAHAALRLRQPYVHTITTNVPGPSVPLYAMGRRLVAVYPYVPLVVGMRVSVGVVSYLDTLFFGVSADFDAVPDLETLTQGIRRGLDELALAAAAGADVTCLPSAP